MFKGSSVVEWTSMIPDESCARAKPTPPDSVMRIRAKMIEVWIVFRGNMGFHDWVQDL